MSKRKKTEPGDILRYRSRPRNEDEILCHNHVAHYPWMSHGANGFRYFVCRRGGGAGRHVHVAGVRRRGGGAFTTPPPATFEINTGT